MLVKDLPKGARLTCIFDCCHSGSMLDLPFTYTIDGDLVVHETDNRAAAVQAAIQAGQAFFLTKDPKAAMQKGADALKLLMQGPGKNDPDAQKRAIAVKTTLADVITLSGCDDSQTSADASIQNQRCGACSWAFKKTFSDLGKDITYTEMLAELRKNLKGKYSQLPQLSAGRKVDLAKSKFTM